MISAREALALPCAQLTEEQKKAADGLEAEIDAHVRKFMAVRGVEFSTTEKDPNVIGEVVARLKLAGYQVDFSIDSEPNKLNPAMRKHTGFTFGFAASVDELRAYRRQKEIEDAERVVGEAVRQESAL